MTMTQPRSTATLLDFPRIDLADDRNRRFEIVRGPRETLIKVHGDAMAELNNQASALTLEDDEDRRRMALVTEPSRLHTREQARRRAAEARARQRADEEASANARRWYHEQLERDRAARSTARALFDASAAGRRSHPSIPRTGPARIKHRTQRERRITRLVGWTAAALCAVLAAWLGVAL